MTNKEGESAYTPNPAEESAKAIKALPISVTAMARMALRLILPFRKRENPRDTQITSVQTMVVELATEVWRRDSNQRVK